MLKYSTTGYLLNQTSSFSLKGWHEGILKCKPMLAQLPLSMGKQPHSLPTFVNFLIILAYTYSTCHIFILCRRCGENNSKHFFFFNHAVFTSSTAQCKDMAVETKRPILTLRYSGMKKSKTSEC